MAVFKRVIPVLLLRDGLLFKGRQFRNFEYVGDPINAIQIFNEKGVDELCLLDISDGRFNREPDYALIERCAEKSFVPLSFGGGLSTLAQAKNIYKIGVEKLVFNTACIENPELLSSVSNEFGRQAVVASIDIRKTVFGSYRVQKSNGKATKLDPLLHARNCITAGAGELLITSVEREGVQNGLDLNLISKISDNVSVPVIAHGGVGTIEHLVTAFKETSVSAVGVGSFFTFYGKYKAVLLSYVPPECRRMFDE